jgi:hypothetical protein
MAVPGVNAYVAIGAHGGALTQINTWLETFDLGVQADSADIKLLGTVFAEKMMGILSATSAMKGPWKRELDAIIWAAVIAGSLLDWEYGPEGNTVTGMIKYTGTLYIQSYKFSSSASGPVPSDVTLAPTGVVTRGTYTV